MDDLERKILACPSCHAPLKEESVQTLVCRGCRLTFPVCGGIADFLTPLLDDDSKPGQVIRANRQVHDQLGGHYDTDPLIAQQQSAYSNRRLREILKESILDLAAPELLVDIGTGTGLVLEQAKGLVGQTLGFDVSLGMLREAKIRGHRVHVGDAAHLPVASAVADIVVIDSVLHHLYDIPSVLAESFRILKEGGYLITDWDPNGYTAAIQKKRPYQWLLHLSKSVRHFLAGHRETFDRRDYEMAEYHRFQGGILPDELECELRKAGFGQVRVIVHANHKSVKTLDLWSMPLLSLVRCIVVSLLGWTLKKRDLYEIILSISRK